jgi:F0F1-type ATP synthase assembly protein I
MSEEPQDDFWKEVLRGLGLLQVILGEIFGFSLAGVGIGYLSSRYLGTPKLGMMVLGSVGLGVGMYRLYRMGRRS